MTTITEQQEPDFIVDQVFSARHALETFKRNQRANQEWLEAKVIEAETALKDYMKGNGLVKFKTSDNHSISLSESTSTEITCEVDELPERFIRIKKEPNKILINEAIKAGEQFNWIAYKTTGKLTIK
jgi:hypothetical protein